MHMLSVWCCDAVCSSPSSLSSNTGLLDELFAPILFFHLPQWNIDALLSFLSARRKLLLLLDASITRASLTNRSRDSQTHTGSAQTDCELQQQQQRLYQPPLPHAHAHARPAALPTSQLNISYESTLKCYETLKSMKERKHMCCVNLEHKTSHFLTLRCMHHLKAE